MFKTGIIALASALLALSAPLAEAKTFYWISHGSPADPVWTYFLAGARQWERDTGHKVNTSFHNGDVASHQEAVRAAIATSADGIVTSSPDPGSLVEVAQEANEANIPIILRLMRNGIVLIGVPGLAYNIFIGAIILGMMALHSWVDRRQQERR